MTDEMPTHLLAPGRIGALELRNRIIVTAMGVSMSEPDGTCGDRLLAYHERQAAGGAGLIITGIAGVAWPIGAVQNRQLAISEDRFIPGLAVLAETVQRHGARLAVQLHHGGVVGALDMPPGTGLWVPSVPPPTNRDYISAFLPEEKRAFTTSNPVQYRVLSRDDIRTVIEQFASAARRCVEAGVDAVEVNAGHGYLLSEFLSPAFNTRDDEYGGPVENRARLAVEVTQAIRDAVGPDYPIIVKIDTREIGRAGGIRIEDAVRLSELLEAAGADAINASSYHDVQQPKLHTSSYVPYEPGVHIPYAAQVKAAVSIPVITSGRIEPDVADRAIAAGDVDFITMGRKILADPEFPNKLAGGRSEDIRPCIYCSTCFSLQFIREPVRCAVNPETGFESEIAAPAAGPARRFVVVGGGPAGMEAAFRLDQAGHEVILLERGDRLGGTLRFASLGFEPNQRLLEWLIRRLQKTRVDVRLKTEASAAALAAFDPDGIIVATGAIRDMPAIPGGDLPHVFSGADMHQMMLGQQSRELGRKLGLVAKLATTVGAATGATANIDLVRKATHQWMPFGQKIVLVGGELVGLELAEFLTERGRQVTVLEESGNLGRGLPLARRMRLIQELREHGVRLETDVSDLRITEAQVAFIDGAGRGHAVPADHVIVAKGARGDLSLVAELQAKGLRVEAAGDCTGIGYIEGAIRGGMQASQQLMAQKMLQPS